MMVSARNSRMGERLNRGKLCSDRFFSARIMSKYLGKRNRSSGMPQMIFGEKASRFFSFRLQMLLTIPAKVMNRYFPYRKDLYPSFDHAVSARFFTTFFSPAFSNAVRQEFHWKQVVWSLLAVPGALAAAASRLGYARAVARAVRQGFNSFAGGLSTLFSHPSTAALQRGHRENLTRYGRSTRHERFFASFAEKVIRHTNRTFIDQISKRRSMVGGELKRRLETPVFALPSRASGIHAASGRRRDAVTGEAGEIIFHNTDKTGREMDELRRVVKKTVDGVHEKVARQVREIMTERNQQVDVGNLTLQVYRNMERMIRLERERRGM